MAYKSPEEKITEIHVVLLGVPDTDEMGLVGDMKDVKEYLRELNGQVKINTMFRKIGTWVSCTIILGLVGIVAKLVVG